MDNKSDMTQEAMLKNIMALDLYLTDLNLYLDTHPCDDEAISYFKKYTDEKNILAKRYQELYGPLTTDFVKDENYWRWIEDPWPWEKRGG